MARLMVKAMLEALVDGRQRPPAWTPVGLSADLVPGRVRPTRLTGQDVALWREPGGTAHVWRDQCPHRGMRLSFGSVRDGQLACVYHGWRFGPDTRCEHVPADPAFKPSPALCATAYACAERDGWIWASLDHQADESAIPRTEAVQGGAHMRSLLVRAAAGDLLEVQGESVEWDVAGFLHVILKTNLGSSALVGALQPLGENRACLHFQTSESCCGAAGVRVHRALTGLRAAWEAEFGSASIRG